MKKLLTVLVIALMLTGIALSVSADPIEVGGECCSFASFARVLPVKGPVGFTLCCSPIEVGGE